MKKKVLLFITLALFASGYAQSPWSPADEQRLAGQEKLARDTSPLRYKLFSLDNGTMQAMLQAAPTVQSSALSTVIVPFPDGNGKIMHFRVYEAPVMHPGLAALHPEIKSYTGQCIEYPSASVRFSTTLFGLHAMILSPEGTTYIDPYTKDLQNYIVYKKAGLKAARQFGCGVTGEAPGSGGGSLTTDSAMANDGILRTYRLAMACTVEYAAFHVNAAGLGGGTEAQKKAAVLAAMNVTMTRVNGIFERDLSLTMQIVPQNENIIFITSDNLTNNSADTMLNEIQSIINTQIGTANYDIGHVVGTGDGGIASLGAVCTSNKARGVTGNPSPVGDPFDIDYVAHEMGHQFGASHTFNNSFQRSASTAVEPGSGSTIMAYAGISPPNVQNNSDAYFHTVSMDQIFNFINGTGSCATQTPNGNSAPVIPVLQSRTIPKSTAFVLRGSATDANGDALTYCWEQTNANGAASTMDETPMPTSTSGPNFRSLPPSESPNRYMPELQNVLNGNLAPTWEVVPSVARTMNFSLTVRDNRIPNGGQTAKRNITVNVNGTEGPFTVTSQNSEGISWEQGSSQTVTWNVAGTTANGINTANVNILLSTDGGQTFDTVLVANTPNDGSETITVPDVAAPYCRIMVEGAGNIFYAVNSTPFAVGYIVTTTCTTYTNNTSTAIPDSATGFSVSGINVPDDVTITKVTYDVDIAHTATGNLFLMAVSPDNTQVMLWQEQCGNDDNLDVTFSDSGSAVACGSPTTGTVTPLEPLAAFNGEPSQGNWLLAFADPYPGNTGTLNSWSVEVCSQTVVPLGRDNFGLEGFTLYPNPTAGSFTVSFNSATGNDIKISMHDMRGREIYKASFANTGLFSGNISPGAAQAGIYLVTVQDGSRKEVRKVIIE